MAMTSFFSSLKSYGKWDLVGSEKLTEQDKNSIDRAEVVDGEYGLSVCFFLAGTRRVKMVQLEDDCVLPIGGRVDLDTLTINHYSDGTATSHRAKCSLLNS